MQIFESIKDFTINNFSGIVLFFGLIILISSTIDMNNNRKPKDVNDKLNTYYGLNVTSTVLFSLFVANQYFFPYLNKNTH
jgi:hypothetical protein